MAIPVERMGRRRFFRSLAASAAGAATLAAAVGAPQPAVRKTTPSAAGYRLTGHVRRYYRTTQV